MADLLPLFVSASEVQLLAEERFPADELPVEVVVSARDIVLVSTRRFETAELAPLLRMQEASNE